jgi:polar amino acid transport system permease protein
MLCPVLISPAASQQSPVYITVKDYMYRTVENASVYLNDNFVGTTNYDGLVVLKSYPSGIQNITATKEGLANRTVEKELIPGETIIISLKKETSVMDPNAVAFIVLENRASMSKIAGASVYVDGQLVGTTNTRDGQVIGIVPPGEHSVKVVKQGLLDNTSIINIVPGSTYTIMMDTGKKFSIFDIDLFFYALSKEVQFGLVNTLKLSIIAMAVGLFIGLVMGLGRVSHSKLFRGLSSIYVEGVRGLPLLLQLLFVNFGLPFMISDLTGGQFNIDSFTACIIALSVNSGAYMAEIFKAGIEAIHKGQMEAARSLGMTYNQSMRYIVLPQAFKIVLPALGNEFIALIKDSSIGLVISVMEILWWSKTVGAESYNTFTPLLAAGLVYLSITIPLGRLVQYMEKKYKIENVRKDGAGVIGKKRKMGGKPEGSV